MSNHHNNDSRQSLKQTLGKLSSIPHTQRKSLHLNDESTNKLINSLRGTSQDFNNNTGYSIGFSKFDALMLNDDKNDLGDKGKFKSATSVNFYKR